MDKGPKSEDAMERNDERETAQGESSLMTSARLALAAVRSPASTPLSMREYVDLLRDCSRPTAAQIEAFADHVSSAHSWYKHLPLFPPGRPFHFFPDPWAGMDTVVTPEGRVEARERGGERGFHYSWIPTADYREQFGCLNYHTTRGSSFFLPEGMIVNPRPPLPTLLTPNGPVGVPEAVIEVGRVLCTGIIHHRTDGYRYWTSRWAGPWRDVDWPDEYGGEALKLRIIRQLDLLIAERECPTAKAPVASQPGCAQPRSRLHDILAPERQRQRDTMCNAIRRACDLVWG